MPDIEKVLKGLECCSVKHNCSECPYEDDMYNPRCIDKIQIDAMAILTELKNLLGYHQTAAGIRFISAGEVLEGEKRGILLGKAWMYEHLQKELLYKGLMTDEIKEAFRVVKLE